MRAKDSVVRMLVKSRIIASLSLLAPLALASGCSLENPGGASLIIDLGNASPGGSQIDLSNGLLELDPMGQLSVTTPADLSGFECLSVNVIGEGIATYDHWARYYNPSKPRECRYHGIKSHAVFTNSGGTPQDQTVELVVPAGPRRLIQVIGFQSNGLTCDYFKNMYEFERHFSDTSSWDAASLHEVGWAVADLFGDTSVNVPNTFNPAQYVNPYQCPAALPSYEELIRKTPGLAGYWRLDEPGLASGGADSSGAYGNLGTYSATGISFRQEPAVGGRHPGTSISAASVGGYVLNMPMQTQYQMAASQDFALELWFWNDSNCVSQILVEAYHSGPPYPTFRVECDAVGKGQFSVQTTGGATYGSGVGTGPFLTNQAWHHLVGQRVGSNLEIWVDGELRSSTAGPTEALAPNGGLRILYGNSHYDEVAIYRQALPASEIMKRWELGRNFNQP
ncbi:MAG: LamG domain-containing protein [Bdellovibrionales bacterium]|nr:LamG domain-containing protein [Bdellovibrionales bacterium]